MKPRFVDIGSMEICQKYPKCGHPYHMVTERNRKMWKGCGK